MLKIALIALAAIFSTAAAAQMKVVADDCGTTVTVDGNVIATPSGCKKQPKVFTIRDLLMIGNGLAQIDGIDYAVKDGQTEKTVHKTFNFSVEVRWIFANNIDKIRTVASRYKTARDLMIKAAAERAKVGSEEYRQIVETQDEALLSQPADSAQLTTVHKADLRLEENPIPAAVLSLVMPIIKD